MNQSFEQIIRSIEIKKRQKMLDFDFKRRYMKEEKDIASMENEKGYWSESYWLYVLIMSRTRFRVNPHSIVAWMSRNSLLETAAKSEV